MSGTTVHFRFARASTLALAIVLCGMTAGFAEPLVNVYYDPITGNLKLQNTSASPVKLLSYDILTLGNGDAQGAPTPSGQGYLTGSAALVPSPQPPYVTSNTEPTGVNGLYSQIYAATTGTVAFLTLNAHPTWSAANPIGAVGSYFDFGNVAALGMTQSDLNSRFITVADLTPGFVSLGGNFLFDYEVSPGTFAGTTPGNVVALVPEPSVLTLCLAATGIGVMRLLRSGKRRPTRSVGATDRAEVPRDDDSPREF